MEVHLTLVCNIYFFILCYFLISNCFGLAPIAYQKSNYKFTKNKNNNENLMHNKLFF